MPGERQPAQNVLGEAFDAKLRQDALEVAPVQQVELREGQAAAPYLLHGGLVLPAPGVREGSPVEPVAERRQHALALPRDPCAPVDEGAEDVEEEGAGLVAHAPKLRGRGFKSSVLIGSPG